MKIVVVAPESDNHTFPLKWALEQAGYRVACWAGVGWQEERQVSISLSAKAQLALGPHVVEPGDVVWIRRPQTPQGNPNTAEADRRFAQGEYRWFHHSILYLLEALPVRCVNKYSASRFINNKSVQLLLAESCGLLAPKTLMSNSPKAVRDYFRQAPERQICKTFFPHIWQNPAGRSVAVTETFELTPGMLPGDEVLTYAPAIFQSMVVKQFDVRMVLLGQAVYSYSLHNPKGAIDWRQDASQGLVKVESIETPLEVKTAVLAFAEKSGIVHGSFDFAVDDQGRWWFLEVNESGQFLWLDEFNRDLHLQEKFLAFLTSPEGSSPETIEEKQLQFPSWTDYLHSPARDQYPPEQTDPDAAFLSIER